jgi:hypothetical protein
MEVAGKKSAIGASELSPGLEPDGFCRFRNVFIDLTRSSPVFSELFSDIKDKVEADFLGESVL